MSTYAYAWRRRPENEHPFTVRDVLDDAVRLGVGLVQVCDAPELEGADDAWLTTTAHQARERGLVLETGTKGVEPEHLRAHPARARALDA